tara:strand:- start:612 stop:884 length:273 start_codon:yes stop_codon:yes gene_type:complete
MSLYQKVNDIEYVDGVEINLEPLTNEQLLERLGTVSGNMAHAKDRLEEVKEQREKVVKHCLNKSMTIVSIAKGLGVTRQWVYHILGKRYR